MDTLRGWGLSNVHAERFAFGAGWSLERFHAHLVEPQVMPVIGYPKAWSSGTGGTVTPRWSGSTCGRLPTSSATAGGFAARSC